MRKQQLGKIEQASVYKIAFMSFSPDTWQNVRVSLIVEQEMLLSGSKFVGP